MTSVDEPWLDDPGAAAETDSQQMLAAVASSAAQVREAATLAAEVALDPLLGAGRPRSVVVAGMGGSGVSGDVLAAVAGPGCPVPVVVHRDYDLPGWVGVTDLVVAVSCSGRTEETLSAAEAALRRGVPLVGVGAEGSPLAELAAGAGAPFLPARARLSPRSSLWALAVPLVVLADRLRLLSAPPAVFEATADRLEGIALACRPDSESFVNPAKGLALQLAGSLPLVWGAGPLAGLAAVRTMTQLAENAKYPAIAGVLPEANHNQVVAFDGPFAGGPDGFAAELPPVPLRLVLLRDSHEHPQVARRREESARLAAGRGIEVTELAAGGGGPLERLASLVQLIDYATVYLAIAQGIDPGPVATIAELKARIATHMA